MKYPYWIAEVKFKDGSILKTEPFYEYDSGIKVWSAKFSAYLKPFILYISYEKFEKQ